MVKNPPASARDIRDLATFPGSGRSPEKEMPGESQGQRHLEGYSPWGRKSRTQLSDALDLYFEL